MRWSTDGLPAPDRRVQGPVPLAGSEIPSCSDQRGWWGSRGSVSRWTGLGSVLLSGRGVVATFPLGESVHEPTEAGVVVGRGMDGVSAGLRESGGKGPG